MSEIETAIDPLNMRLSMDFVASHIPTQRLDASSLDEGNALASTEIINLLNGWENFRSTGRLGSLLDICIPVGRNNETIPMALKVINPYGSRFKSVRDRVQTWATADQIEDAIHMVASAPSSGKDEYFEEQRKTVGMLALEHQKYKELYSPYILPTLFASFIPQVDIAEPKASTMDPEEMKLRMSKGAVTKDGKRLILRKGIPAFVMVQDYFEKITSVQQVTSLSQKEQLRDLILKIESGYERGFYPDPGMVEPDRKNLVFVEDRLVLVDTNFLLTSNGFINRKYLNQILDMLYYCVGIEI